MIDAAIFAFLPFTAVILGRCGKGQTLHAFPHPGRGAVLPGRVEICAMFPEAGVFIIIIIIDGIIISGA